MENESIVNGSIVNGSITKARTIVAAALAGTILFILVLLIERFYFQKSFDDVSLRGQKISEISRDILLFDERLTLYAKMATVTGYQSWVDLYHSTTSKMETALAKAKSLAPDVVEKFIEDSLDANKALIELEQKALKMVDELKNPDKRIAEDQAYQLLNSVSYNGHKITLAHAIRRFSRSMHKRIKSEREVLANQAFFFHVALVLAVGLGIFILWRRLSATLESSRSRFAQSEAQIRNLALNDSLTGLANRFQLEDKACEIMQNRSDDQRALALFIIDLDRFKPINDIFGHQLGDKVLVEISERLNDNLREADCSARYGGDEFVVLVQLDNAESEAEKIALRLIDAISQPMKFDDVEVQVGASIGISFAPDHADNFSDLMRMADIALYAAKNSGRGGAQIFTETMAAELARQACFKEQLSKAVVQGEIIPFFQPIFNLETYETESLEILARWQHPERGLLPPSAFIEDIIEFDLINDLTLSLLRSACRAVQNVPKIALSLNVAAKQLQNSLMVEKILDVLEETGFPADRLKIEITETALITDLERARKFMQSWKDKGIRISIDDFGSGYSSLAYLAQLPFDELKVDKSFIMAMLEKEECRKIVGTIISLGTSLGLTTVGEGIENKREIDLLKKMGCTRGQGYYYAKPGLLEDLDLEGDSSKRPSCEAA